MEKREKNPFSWTLMDIQKLNLVAKFFCDQSLKTFEDKQKKQIHVCIND